MKIAAACTAALLSLLFVGVYSSCNWITAQRADVGTWCFAWEQAIPFVPAMIVPYMSIDLFFVAGPFLCRGQEELRVLSKRIAFAILVAGLCFLLMPLRFAFDRPEPTGWFKPFFQLLYGFDKPHNLFPSLHITLRTILADLYARHTRGWVRIAVHVWFSLIGFSTVLTWQHHLVDVAGGFGLATVCFYLFRESEGTLCVTKNTRIGGYYASGALSLLALSAAVWPWSAILLWPGLSLTIVAFGYWGLGPGIYRKAQGRLPLSAWLLLGPCILGQYVSLCYYRRQTAPWNEIIPGIWIWPQTGCRRSSGRLAARCHLGA